MILDFDFGFGFRLWFWISKLGFKFGLGFHRLYLNFGALIFRLWAFVFGFKIRFFGLSHVGFEVVLDSDFVLSFTSSFETSLS